LPRTMAREADRRIGVARQPVTALPSATPGARPEWPAVGVPGEVRESGGRRWRLIAVAGYALHLFTVFALALSNILLGLTLVAAPRALAERRVDWRVLRPVLLPMGFYLVFLTASIALSYEPRVSLYSFGETFAMATLYLGPGLVRG